MSRLTENHKPTKLTVQEKDNLNRPIPSKESELVKQTNKQKNYPQRKAQIQMALLLNSTS